MHVEFQLFTIFLCQHINTDSSVFLSTIVSCHACSHAYFIEDTLPIIVKAHSKLCEHKEAI